jgi:hypothetical protein
MPRVRALRPELCGASTMTVEGPVRFDADGVAEVTPEQAAILANVPTEFEVIPEPEGVFDDPFDSEGEPDLKETPAEGEGDGLPFDQGGPPNVEVTGSRRGRRKSG